MGSSSVEELFTKRVKLHEMKGTVLGQTITKININFNLIAFKSLIKSMFKLLRAT